MMSKPGTRCVCPLGRYATTAALLAVNFVFGVAAGGSDVPLSLTPPRGWNSYDSFSWIVSEEEFLQNAEYVAENLLEHGYEYVVVDFLWYRKHEPGVTIWSAGYDIIDEWGRPLPDPARWPSTAGGKGFKPIADKVHAMGLKFGIHVMRGIDTAAVQQNTPILCNKDCPDGFQGQSWTAKDIALPGGQCSWMPACFTSVNTSSAGGIAFINSLYQQYAEWEVDLIKNDCVFGVDDLNVAEIAAVGKAIGSTGRPILYSLSPGVSATPDLGKQVAHLSHMYRITSDDWDSWGDVLTHFPVARDFAAAGLIGAPGLAGGKSWPDMDMLPIGWLTDPGAPYGPYRSSSLTKDEQMTQMTLWAIAKSPLMFGGDLRHMDQWTLDLITQPILLEMNAHSSHNRELSSSVQSSLPNIALADCDIAKSFQWKLKSTESGQDELCWSRISKPGFSKGRHEAPLTDCLNFKHSLLPIPDLSTSWTQHGIKHVQLRSTTTETVCLESNGILNNESDRTTALFSRCNGKASQVWQLIGDNLVSHENGLCAVVREPTQQWKVWVARGSEGQSYVAFFNLGSDRIDVSARVGDVLDHVSFVNLANAEISINHPSAWLSNPRWHKIMSWYHRSTEHLRKVGRSLMEESQWSCAGKDVWNNTHFIAHLTELIASVESHGTVLYELRCTPGKGSWFYSPLIWIPVVLCVLIIGVVAYKYFATRSQQFYYAFSGSEEGADSIEAQEATPLTTIQSWVEEDEPAPLQDHT
ncbi:unnamed protein product [Calypogeia fissa]